MQFAPAPLRLPSVATAPETEPEEDDLPLVEPAPHPAASSAVAATAATPATRSLRLRSNMVCSFVPRRMAGQSRAPVRRDAPCASSSQVKSPGVDVVADP